MSLQVWLPLNGDIENKGLGQYSITTLGTLSWVTGKLSASAMRAGDGTQIVNGLQINDNFTTLLNGDYTISVWVKPYGTHIHYNGSIMSSGNWNTANKRWNFGISQDNTKVDVLGFNYNTYINCPVPVNEWTHLVCVCGSDRIIKLFKNGLYIGQRDGSSDPAIDSDASVTCIGRESYASGYFSFNGAIQDLKLYDNALSETEIKKLSQGLVLHLPLNNNGLGNENLLLNTQVLTPSSSYTTKNCSQRGSSVRQLREDGFYEAKCTSSWQGLSTWANAQNLVVGQKYTYSFYFYTDGSTKSLSFYPMMYNSGGTRDTSSTLPISVDGSAYQNSNAKSFGRFSNKSPIKHYVTFEWNSTMASIISNGGTIELSAQVHGTFNNGEYGCLYAPKLELGDKATPWSPNPLDENYPAIENNIYDNSGYCHNAVCNNITYSSDTPKYNVSSVFNGSNSYVKVIDNYWMADGMPEATINLWAKATTWPTNGGRLLSCTESGGFNLEAGNTGYWRFPVHVYTNEGKTSYAYKYDSNEIKIADLIPNEWNMITLVYDKSGTKTYLNGVLNHTYTNTSYGIKFNTNARLFLGCEASAANPSAPYFNGKESDFRLYATALSENDVKSLYNNNAYIDSDGNIYGKIR